MSRWLYLIPILVSLGLSLLFVIGIKNNSGNIIPSTLTNRLMPALPKAALLDYPTGDIQAMLNENDILLVNFFASWCAPCRAEHPSLISLSEKGVSIVGINYQDNPENAMKFIEELGNPYAAIRADEKGRTGIDWGLSGVPETFFINSDGIIIKRFFGPITQRSLEEEILPFISENS